MLEIPEKGDCIGSQVSVLLRVMQKLNIKNNSALAAPVILSALFTYSFTNYLFLESLGYHGLLFTAGSLVCVYQIGFFLCTFIIRIIFKKRIVNRSLFHVLILIILPSFFGLTVQAQEKKVSWDDYIYTSAWGYLYSDASERSQRLGVFATHAAIIVLDSTTSYYHVMVSNGDIGFIERQPLVGRLFASKYYGEPSEYFYRGKEGFQSPHRYVQVAELRVRSGPSTECNVVGKVAINEMAFFDYWPLYRTPPSADGSRYIFTWTKTLS